MLRLPCGRWSPDEPEWRRSQSLRLQHWRTGKDEPAYAIESTADDKAAAIAPQSPNTANTLRTINAEFESLLSE
jgi:hypothetical protein